MTTTAPIAETSTIPSDADAPPTPPAPGDNPPVIGLCVLMVATIVGLLSVLLLLAAAQGPFFSTALQAQAIQVAHQAIALATSALGNSSTAPTPTSAPPTTPDETQYLIFNAGEYGDPSLSKGAAAVYADAVYKDVDTKVADFMSRIGTAGDGKHKLGFMIILPVWYWNSGLGGEDGQADAVIGKMFDLAATRNIAVYFTIDTNYGETANIYNWWDPSQPGYNPANKSNVEWTDWDGTPTKVRYNLQGSGAKLPPVMCYNSPAILKESSYIARSVVAPAIEKGIASLKSVGKENLFAGITLGLEPSLDDYSVMDQLDPALGKEMDQDGARKVALGYCALTNSGYSKSNPPTSFSLALAKINQDYTSYWGKALVDAGISKNKLYTHVAAGAEGPLLQYTNAPLDIAFNDYSRPGWTTYAAGPIANNFNVLYDLLAKHGTPHWAATETSPTSVNGKTLNPETFLAWHFNHGAAVMVINTGDTSAGGQVIGRDIWAPRSIAAYKKFLSGAVLRE